MIGLRGWTLVGAATVAATAPVARADLAAPQPVSVQVVITPDAPGSATAGDGGAAQTGPVNVNVQVIVDSPGAVTGPVSQTNTATGGMAAPATPPTPATPTVETPPTPRTPDTPSTPETPPTPPSPPTPPTPSTPAPPTTSAAPAAQTPVVASGGAAAFGGTAPEPANSNPPAPAVHHDRSGGPHRTAKATHVVARVARTAATPQPVIASAPRIAASRRPARPVKERAARRPAHPPLLPLTHRFAGTAQEGSAAGGGGFALVLALVLALLLTGPAGPGEPVAALRQRARAAMGRRLEHPG